MQVQGGGGAAQSRAGKASSMEQDIDCIRKCFIQPSEPLRYIDTLVLIDILKAYTTEHQSGNTKIFRTWSQRDKDKLAEISSFIQAFYSRLKNVDGFEECIKGWGAEKITKTVSRALDFNLKFRNQKKFTIMGNMILDIVDIIKAENKQQTRHKMAKSAPQQKKTNI